MNKLALSGFIVYWVIISDGEFCPRHAHFTMQGMNDALKFANDLRNNTDAFYVTFVSQNPDMVGKVGVSDKLPEDYSWSKQGRAGTERKRSKSIMGEHPNE
jgi:hypothetical protein